MTKQTRQAIIVSGAMLLACLAAVVIGVKYKDIMWWYRMRRLTFSTWDQAMEFLQKREKIPAGKENLEQCKKDSATNDFNIQNYSFRGVAFDYRCKSNPYGIRGASGNGDYYVFRCLEGKYILIGEFLGNGMAVIEKNGQIHARIYYHYSAADLPSTDYPLVDGIFEYVDPDISYDLSK